LPNAFGSNKLSSRKEVEIGWSAELTDTQLSGTLREMPMGTIVNKETGRHWFLTRHTLVQDKGAWRISQMTDEGARLQGLTISELQQQLKDIDDQMQDVMQKNNPNSPEAQEAVQEIAWRMDKALYYDDALIVKLPLERTYYEDAYSRALALNLVERALVYIDRLVQKFPEQLGMGLRNKAILQESLSAGYYELGMNERGTFFAEHAEATIRASLEVENDIAGHAFLAEALIRQGKNYDEAEEQLHLAMTMAKNVDEEAMIEADLGNLELQRDHLSDALHHYQRVAEIDPNFPDIWFKIGFMQRNLQQFEEAQKTYEHAIEVQPQDIRSYSELTTIYMNDDQFTKARETLEQGLRAIPKSPHLLALLSSVYAESGDMRKADTVLQEAEQVNPKLEIVQAVREHLNTAKKK
ncbi:MAG: tetratricopeptide repeat protein, partial [Chloroflexota bacterium]|nr:tetratricopeptide repeat protein [Chloroflexota bacterium]